MICGGNNVIRRPGKIGKVALKPGANPWLEYNNGIISTSNKLYLNLELLLQQVLQTSGSELRIFDWGAGNGRLLKDIIEFCKLTMPSISVSVSGCSLEPTTVEGLEDKIILGRIEKIPEKIPNDNHVIISYMGIHHLIAQCGVSSFCEHMKILITEKLTNNGILLFSFPYYELMKLGSFPLEREEYDVIFLNLMIASQSKGMKLGVVINNQQTNVSGFMTIVIYNSSLDIKKFFINDNIQLFELLDEYEQVQAAISRQFDIAYNYYVQNR